MREENEIEKNDNESEDGVVEHSKVQALESRKICQKFTYITHLIYIQNSCILIDRFLCTIIRFITTVTTPNTEKQIVKNNRDSYSVFPRNRPGSNCSIEL